MFSDYAVWQYVHILLFVYWLGADLGVFFAARYVARADLGLEERLRFLELLLKVDMGPRTALILIIPVGFTLASELGIVPFVEGWLPAIWLFCIAWLGLAWSLFLSPRHAAAAALQRVDRLIRQAVNIAFHGLGLISLAGDGPVAAPWLAAKFVLFAGVVTIGLVLRGVIREWVAGFATLRKAEQIDSANDRIGRAHHRATRLAIALWVLVAGTAFIGVTKPLFP
jgi:hypothetical protein